MADAAAEEEGGPPPGVESVFLTGTTLKLVGIEDMGPELLIKSIDKEVILHDVQFRGAISDFHVIKDKLKKCDYDMIMIRYNENDIYGDGNNFEIACKKAAADQWVKDEEERKAAAEAAALKAAEEADAKKPGRKKKKKKESAPWQSQGSEIDIEEASVIPTRDPVTINVYRKRREFNQGFKLSDKDSQELWNSSQMECRPFKDPNYELKRMEHDIAVQAVPPGVTQAVQATAARPKHGGAQYEARQMEMEQIVSNLKDDSMSEFLGNVQALTEEALQQNEAFDIFENEFAALADDDSAPGNKSENVITEYQSFTDLTYSKGKLVSCIDWMTVRKGEVAVACSEPLSFEERVEASGRMQPSAILIWNFIDPIHPQYVLESPMDVFCFQFNPVNQNLVAAGLLNGQVVLWDTSSMQEQVRKKEKKSDGDDSVEKVIPVCKHLHASELPDSHTTTVTDLKWLGAEIEVTNKGKVGQNKSGECNFFATTSPDGKVMFWDIRVKKDLKKNEIFWIPTFKIGLTRGEIAGDLGAFKFIFGNISSTTKFFCTSMDGEVAYCDFEKPDGETHPEHTKMVSDSHSGQVVAVERSPFFPDIILSVGDWTFKIFKEGVSTPLFSSPSADAYLVSGCWSPTRPGVIYTAKQDGTMEVWDLLDRSHEASMLSTVTSFSITSMKFWPSTANQQLLAVGDSSGVLHIMELPRNLRRALPNEKVIMNNLFERELSRVEDVEQRGVVRAAELKELEANAKEGAGAEAGDEEKKEVVTEATAAKKSEEEYHTLEREFMIQMGLIEEEEPAA